MENLIEKELNDLIETFRDIQDEFPVYFNNLVNDFSSIAESLKIQLDEIVDSSVEDSLMYIRSAFLKNEENLDRNYFTITSKDSFTNLPSINDNDKWGKSLIYYPLNDHSRSYLKKGDVLYCYRQGQFNDLNEALTKRGIYAVGIAASNPELLFPDAEKHNKWGVLVCFPIIIPHHLELRSIQMHPDTIDLTPYNGNRNDALQLIHEEKHFSTLLNMVFSKNNSIQDKMRRFFEDISFKKIELPENILNKFYSNVPESNSLITKKTNSNFVQKMFIEWFFEPDNFKKSYEGLVNLKVLNFWDECFFNNSLFAIDINDIENSYRKIELLISDKNNIDWKNYSEASSKGAPEAVLGKNNYLKFLVNFLKDGDNVSKIKNNYSFELNGIKSIKNDFDSELFQDCIHKSGLIFSPKLVNRFISSLCTKPFVICTGLSGSGKTKLAQAFVQWISYDESQYLIVPVGADWTNREPLLGYPNALTNETYVTPENGVLQLILSAKENCENKNEPTKPYFLILDEMNLSHVERYFADFLSAMESGDKIPLHKMQNFGGDIPSSFYLPKNLFIIGTVNIDETTYMFSPKVLDRANTIEFRLSDQNLEDFIKSDLKLNLDLLKGQGASMSESFMELSLIETDKNLSTVETDLKLFFSELKKSGAEFGYRTASEIGRLMYMLGQSGENGNDLLDIAIMQKLLPKLHGSRNKLTKVLPVLGSFCLINTANIKEEYLDKYVANIISEKDLEQDSNVKYRISLEKICRMYKNAIENGFASYAEA